MKIFFDTEDGQAHHALADARWVRQAYMQTMYPKEKRND